MEERCGPTLIERREGKHSPACTADAPPRTCDTSTQKVSKNTFDLRRGMKYSREVYDEGFDFSEKGRSSDDIDMKHYV